MTDALPRSTHSLSAELRLTRGDFRLDVTCRVAPSGMTGVYGPSGAGKSTLLRCLAGLDPHCEGTVRRHEHAARGVGVVFQDSRLFSHLDVRGNLRYGYRRTRTERRSTFDDVVQWLDLAVLLPRLPHSLSGGERQRVALGRALLAQPRVLLLDEPLAALDRRRKRDLLPYLARLRAELAIPMLYVSHQVDELIECYDLLVLEQGRLVATGPLPDLLTHLDLTLAQDEDAGALITATVAEHD